MSDLISRNAALDYHITISDLPGDTKIDELVGIGVGERLYKRHIKGLTASEAQPETKVTFYDKDHVWIDGKQYISLRGFQEKVKEAGPKEGEWVQIQRYTGDAQPDLECPFCKHRIGWFDMGRYCAGCGAKLKGGAG